MTVDLPKWLLAGVTCFQALLIVLIAGPGQTVPVHWSVSGAENLHLPVWLVGVLFLISAAAAVGLPARQGARLIGGDPGRTAGLALAILAAVAFLILADILVAGVPIAALAIMIAGLALIHAANFLPTSGMGVDMALPNRRRAWWLLTAGMLLLLVSLAMLLGFSGR